MLSVVDFLPDGTRVASESAELRHWVRVLKEGDNLLGWEGDPNIEVMVDLSLGEFDVWTLDAHGEPFLVLSRPYCDQRLVRDIIRADTRRRDVAHDAMVQSQKAQAAAEASRQEAVDASLEKLQWALRRDLGHLDGGTRMIHAIGGRR